MTGMTDRRPTTVPDPENGQGRAAPATVARGEATPTVAQDLAVLRHVERQLGDVDAALRRLDDGTYETCEICGAAIDEVLLAGAPLARRCERCDPAAPAP